MSDVEAWFGSRMSNDEGRMLLHRLRDGGFLTTRMEPTRKGLDVGEVTLRMIEQHQPGSSDGSTTVEILALAEEVLLERDPETPRDKLLGSLLLFGLVVESVTYQQQTRRNFGRRVSTSRIV